MTAARAKIAAEPLRDVFDEGHYASTVWQKLKRAIQLGPKYYAFDLPRYLRNRRAIGLPWWDARAFFNPLREFRRKTYHSLPLPPGYPDALRQLHDTGVRLTMPRGRLEALLGVWWSARDVPGDVIECGAYRGATSLLIALLGRMHTLSQNVLLLDTFQGIPNTSTFDVSRNPGEFMPEKNQSDRIRCQADALDVGDRVEVCTGLFADTFAMLENRELRFAFVHVDANIYQGTWEACQFTIPRTNAGGAVVFDDYNGVCDLGARLAIERYCTIHELPLVPLAGSSALLRL
jgi:hypothetical protein